jgi:hypothetical protein
VVGLHVRLEHRRDLRPLRLGAGDVVVDEVDVRIDDGELALALAPEQIGSARCVVVEELAEVHGASLRSLTLDKVSIDHLNRQP